MTDAAEVRSPRLVALSQALARSVPDALTAFWTEMRELGTPLVEPLLDAPEQALVTFLWRSTTPTSTVVVVGGLAGLDFANQQMTHLPGTDLWYRTYRARTDLRTTYRLSPNDALVPFERVDDWVAREATWQVDPLNRHPYPPDAPLTSSFALAAAPPQPWIVARDGADCGTVAEHRVRSAHLGDERSVWVYTSPGYAPDGPPGDLLLTFDGWAYVHLMRAPTTLDNLRHAAALAPLVAVFIGNATGQRSRDLACHPPFIAFLVDELLPWARERYRFTSDPARTVVAGSSLGGLAATYAGLRRPDLFGNVLTQSGSFYWGPDTGQHYWGSDYGVEYEWLPRQFVAAPPLPLRFFMEVGLLESLPRGVNSPTMVLANRHFRDILVAKGYALRYAEFNGGHDYVCWQGSFADGLLALLGDTGGRGP
jgi:enterochelin esterase-like enzyme